MKEHHAIHVYLRYAMLFLLLIALSGMTSMHVFASDKSDGAVMKKVLQSFKAGNYTQAQEYANTLPRYAQEKCVRKMSKKMKKAYRKEIKRHKPQLLSSSGGYKMYDCVTAYYLTDVNNDGVADLLISYGSTIHCKLYIYTYKAGKLVKLHEGYISDDRLLFAYPGHKGIVYQDAKQGGERLIVLKFSKKKCKEKIYGSRTTGTYLDLGLKLARHTSYSTKKQRYVVNYSALK